MEITIRPLRPDDADDMQRLVNAPGVVWGTTHLGVATVAAQRTWIEERADAPNRHTLGAECDGAIVGAVSLTRSAGRLAHVGHLGIEVRDDYTGQGIGAALMAAILDLADNWLNLHRVELDVQSDNERAIRLYEKFGFMREGTRRDLVFRAGRYVDCDHMARLRPPVTGGGA